MKQDDLIGYRRLFLKTAFVLISLSISTLSLVTALPRTLWAVPHGVVANSGGTTPFLGSVTVFDFAVIGGAPVTVSDTSFNKPRWVAVTSDNHFAAVTNAGAAPGNGTITWIALPPMSPSAIGVTSVIPSTDTNGNSRLRGIAINGNLAVVAVNDPDTATQNDHVIILDLSCLPDCDVATSGNQPPGAAQVLATIPLGTGKLPEGVAITADGSFALIAETNGRALAYVDLTTVPPVLLGTTSLGTNRPFGVALTPDMRTAVVTNRQDNTLSILDISCLPDCDRDATNGDQPPAAPLFTFSVGHNAPQGVAVTPDGGEALIAHGLTPGLATLLDLSCLPDCDASLSGNQPPGPGQISTIPLGNAPFGVAIPSALAGSQRTAVSNEDSKAVSILDLRTNPVAIVDTVTPGNFPRGLAMTAVAAPKAKLDATPKTGRGPLTVTFNGISSFDPDGVLVSCSLDFGDGTPLDTTVCSTPVTHVYAATPVIEKLSATLEVTDNEGISDTTKVTIVVLRDRAPIAAFTATPRSGVAPLLVTFTNRSRDPDGTVTGFQWDFGDGATSTEPNPTHVYSTPGKFVVTLIVTDENGTSSVRPRKAAITVR